MFNKEKLIYYLQGGLMILIFISPYLFIQYGMPFIKFSISQFLAIIFGLTGMFLSISTIKAMGKSFETKPRPKVDGELVTKFPFSISRNPMYMASFLLTLSWSFGHNNLMTLILSLLLQIVLVVKVHMEEDFLQEKFKQAYTVYKEKVPRWLLF